MFVEDTPILIRAVDDDGHGQSPRLTDASLLVLAQEVIQRLSTVARHAPHSHQPDVEGFCIALMEPDAQEARLILLRAHASGLGHEDLCIQYIAAAARQLGQWWDDDVITFREMAIAAGRMLGFLRDLRDLIPPPEQRGSREALFTCVPGEQHFLGVTMAADLMRDRGWKIDLRINETIDTLCRQVRDHNYLIIGLSATNADRIRTLAATVVELRLAAPHARIFIGGHLLDVEPDIASRIGADAAGSDIETCVSGLENLYQELLAHPT